jgi:hypothetical protein
MATSVAVAGNGQAVLSNIPQNAAIVMHIDVEQIRSLSLYQMIWGMISAQPEVQEVLTEMQAQAGFDPNTDISGITMMLSGEDDDRWGVLVEGNFDSARIATYLSTIEATEMATQEYQGRTVYFNPSDSEGDRSYFTILSDNVVAAGTQNELSAMLDAGAGTVPNVTANAELNTLLTSTDMSGAFWFSGIMTPAMQAEMVGSPMEGLTTVTGHGNFAGGLNVAYALGTTTPEQATALAAFFNEQVTQARTQPEIAQMGLSSVLDGVSIAASANTVNVSVTVPEQTLNQIIGIFTALMAAEAGGAMPQ